MHVRPPQGTNIRSAGETSAIQVEGRYLARVAGQLAHDPWVRALAEAKRSGDRGRIAACIARFERGPALLRLWRAL